jgi:hypothetical protein
MKRHPYHFSPLLLLITFLLSACGNEQAVTITSISATETSTVIPSETSSSNGATLAGTVFLSNDKENPYPTSVELILKYSLIVAHRMETDSAGMFAIDNIKPGEYELWVLITSDTSMVPECNDVVPPNDTLLGIKFGNNKAAALTQNPSLSKAFDEARFIFETDGSKASGYYVIFPDLNLESGREYTTDVILKCK